jgi:hypothetical protein
MKRRDFIGLAGSLVAVADGSKGALRGVSSSHSSTLNSLDHM